MNKMHHTFEDSNIRISVEEAGHGCFVITKVDKTSPMHLFTSNIVWGSYETALNKALDFMISYYEEISKMSSREEGESQ